MRTPPRNSAPQHRLVGSSRAERCRERREQTGHTEKERYFHIVYFTCATECIFLCDIFNLQLMYMYLIALLFSVVIFLLECDT